MNELKIVPAIHEKNNENVMMMKYVCPHCGTWDKLIDSAGKIFAVEIICTSCNNIFRASRS